ncbi:MAG: hypothetical protein ACI8U3_000826 [Brevundimonas sp.]|jgi:hypothetical protein|uniref:hypothetical protein n=1 Tax=Brevundimonas sp. TaxID=1871086 RepID=UPI0039E288C3
MEVGRRSSEPHRGGLTIAGPLIFLLVVWFGAYFTWRIVHGDRAEQGVVTHVVYPDSGVGRLAHDVFTPLRWLDARYLGVGSSIASGDGQDVSTEA